MKDISKRITVVVSTCDSYSVLWDHFSKCFDKYWETNCDVIFVSETKPHPFFKTVTPGNLPWGERNRIAIMNLKTDYIFWILEDYFLSRPIKEEDIIRYIKDFEKLEMDRLQIGPKGPNKDIESYLDQSVNQRPKFQYEKTLSSEKYSVCLQPSIWRTDYILNILDKKYTPWEFELIGSLKNNSDKIYFDKSVKTHLFFNAVRKKHVKNLSWIIAKIDQVIEKVFYNKLPFKYSKGLSSFLRHEKID